MGDDGLRLFLGQRDELAHQIQAPHREIHGHDFGIDLVRHASLLDLPLVVERATTGLEWSSTGWNRDDARANARF